MKKYFHIFPKSSIDRLNYTINQSNRVEVVDNLRGLAVILVVITHFRIIDLQGISVDLFFVVSGMFVSKGFIKSYYNKELVDLKSFFIKRLTRIFPSYYFLLVIGSIFAYFVIRPIAPHKFLDWSELSPFIFFYKNLIGIPGHYYLDHLWSLSLEEHFYFLFPIVFLVSQKLFNQNNKVLVFIILTIILFSTTSKVLSIFTQIAASPSYTHNRIDSFAWGILLSITTTKPHSFAYKLLNIRLLAAVGISLLILPLSYRFSIDVHNLLLRLMAPLGWCLIIFGLYNVRLEILKPLRYIAYFGFNIYLWHYIIIIPINHYLGEGFLGFITYIIFSGLLGVLATFYIEDFFLRFRKPLLDYFSKSRIYTQQQSALHFK